MPIDADRLLSVWDVRNMPACDEGMELARLFLEAAGRAIGSPEHLEFAMMRSWQIYCRHRSACDKCKEA
jgi:hypothetical protein